MKKQQGSHQGQKNSVRHAGSVLMSIFFLLAMISCGFGPTQGKTPTPTPKPTATVCTSPTTTPTQCPTPVPTAAPTTAPVPTPTPRPPLPPKPTPTLVLGPCDAGPGVQPVSSIEIDRGNSGRPRIALTFDAGGPAEPTASILNTLAKYHLRTTWFITGQWAQQNSGLVQRVHDAGHEIGNHSMTHPDLTTLGSDAAVCNQLTQANQVIAGITGQSTRPYFRPPYGARNDHVRQLAAHLGYRTVYWTIDTLDWQAQSTPDSITAKVMNNLGNGVIVLMHAGSTSEANTLDRLIPMIQQRGYQIVTVSDVL